MIFSATHSSAEHLNTERDACSRLIDIRKYPCSFQILRILTNVFNRNIFSSDMRFITLSIQYNHKKSALQALSGIIA